MISWILEKLNLIHVLQLTLTEKLDFSIIWTNEVTLLLISCMPSTITDDITDTITFNRNGNQPSLWLSLTQKLTLTNDISSSSPSLEVSCQEKSRVYTTSLFDVRSKTESPKDVSTMSGSMSPVFTASAAVGGGATNYGRSSGMGQSSTTSSPSLPTVSTTHSPPTTAKKVTQFESGSSSSPWTSSTDSSSPPSVSHSLESEFEHQTNDERRLVDYLMRNYDNSIRPVRDANAPVVIRLGITLTQIFDLVWHSEPIITLHYHPLPCTSSPITTLCHVPSPTTYPHLLAKNK